MNEFGDLLGTPYAPVSKIAPVKRRALERNIIFQGTGCLIETVPRFIL